MIDRKNFSRSNRQLFLAGWMLFCMAGSVEALTPYQQQQQQQQRQQQERQRQERQRQEEQRRTQMEIQRRQQQRETERQQQVLHDSQELVRDQLKQRDRQLEIQRQQNIAYQNRQIELRRIALREQQARERERLAALKRQAELDRLKRAWNCSNNLESDSTNRPKTITREEARRGYTGRSGGAGRVEVRYKGQLITVPAACISGVGGKSSLSPQPGAGGHGVMPRILK